MPQLATNRPELTYPLICLWLTSTTFFPRSILFSHWIFLRIRPERRGYPWSGASVAAGCGARNSLVLILLFSTQDRALRVRERVTSVRAWMF